MSASYTSARFVVWLAVLCLPGGSVFAQSASDQGQIDITHAQLRDSANGWQLSADAEIELSREIRQGLDSGVPLQFIVDFRLKRPRQYWLDKTVLAIEHRYSLIYYELTRHYRLQSVTTQQSRNYRSLLAALDDLGNIQDVMVNRPVGFQDSEGLVGYLSVRLDGKALPLPLQPLVSSTWRLTSEDFTWSLN